MIVQSIKFAQRKDFLYRNMSKSAILSSSIAKKYWMALTGLFLCLFLVGHLLGNLQLIFKTGEEGKLAFNQYAHFMATNPAVKALAYLTYFSILFHSIDGIVLTVQNKKARPLKYANNNPAANSALPSRYMAVLGTLVLLFISLHMANFWFKSKVSNAAFPLHKVSVQQDGVQAKMDFYITQNGDYIPVSQFEEAEQMTEQGLMKIPASFEIKNGSEIYLKKEGLKRADGYKDLHGLVMSYFGKPKDGFPKNTWAGIAVGFYVLSMAVLSFHLWHGFASSFQSLGLRSKKFAKGITAFGKAFAILVPALFAIIPIIIYFF